MRLSLINIPSNEAAAGRIQYALSESAAGEHREALLEIDAGIADLTAMKSLDPQQLADAYLAKAKIELAQHDVADGCALVHHALALLPKDDEATGWRHAEAQAVYGECLAAQGQFSAARYQLQAALLRLQQVRGADHWMTRSVRIALHPLLIHPSAQTAATSS